MRKTLLLVFIHGFQGGDDTFASFPGHLRALISHALPNIEIHTLIYPKFETRGELKDCVARFREWLQNKVIDLEVASKTPSPTIDPAVHTILVGHSMGGIVAAETLLLLADEQPIPPASSSKNPEAPNFPSNTTLNSTTGTSRPNPKDEPANFFMFPHIQGIIAFDTPFLGLAPGMIAHGLEGTHKMATNAYNTYSEVASMLGWGSTSSASQPAASTAAKSMGALPAPSVDAAAAPTWQSWGKYAMFAGAAGAVVAGGAAALYTQREKISAGWGWAYGHLLFVGDLAKAEVLKKRVEKVELTCKDRGLGCANLYTNLGKGAREGYGITSTVAGNERTFCNLPQKVRLDEKDQRGMKWVKAANEKAKDETAAHCSMFIPRENPGFYSLGEQAKELIVRWVDEGWYASSDQSGSKIGGIAFDDDGEDWEAPGYHGDEKTTAKNNEEHENTLGKDWEGLDKAKGDYDDDVEMREGDKEQDLEDSVIVDKAAHGEIPLPTNEGL